MSNNQPRQEYQLLLILSEQLKQQKGKGIKSWLKKEESKEIINKMHEVLQNFHCQAPAQSTPSNQSAQKKKINFQIR